MNTTETINAISSDLLLKGSSSRSLPSTKIITDNVHAHTLLSDTEDLLLKKTISRPPSQKSLKKNHTEPISRTQHKLMLQRQSFLADDKNYLDHPDNMRRLTKELDRVNREYRNIKQYQDPLALSLQRVMQHQQQQHQQQHQQSPVISPVSSVASSWSSSSSFLIPPRLQRRASSNTIHEYIKSFKEERRHSFSVLAETKSSLGLFGRIFGSQQPPSSQLKRHLV